MFHRRALAMVAVIGAGGLASAALAQRKPRPAMRVEPPAGYVALSAAPPQVTVLTLPVDGAWGVVQGTDSDGTHTGYAAYSLDLVPAESVGTEADFRKRKRLDDHPCYGRAVLAPAAGRVLWARDGARELPPFREGRKHEAGNFVILEHAPGELTEFRHLQRGSLAVKRGDQVEAGQRIANCGNSGNAVTPHLHFAVLGSADPIATRPFVLSGYEVLMPGGAWQPGDGVPKQGQIIRRAPGSR